MSGIRFDPDAIRALAKILTETGLTEIEIAESDSRIRVVRAPAPPASPIADARHARNPGAEAVPTTIATADQDAQHPGAVLSPMVGIVYLSPEPEAAPFVAPGQIVTAGQTLLLIEAMKTFNQIKAPKAGTVAAILVQHSAPVEYGEVLIILE